MSIGEPVRTIRSRKMSENIHAESKNNIFPQEISLRPVIYRMIILFLFFSLFPYILFSPIALMGVISHGYEGLIILIIPTTILPFIILTFIIASPLSIWLILDNQKNNFTKLSEKYLEVHYKASRRTNSIDCEIPYNSIKDIEIQPIISDKDLNYPLKKIVKLFWSVPLPPTGGLYNGLARTENLVRIVLLKRIIIYQVTPKLTLSYIPEKQLVNELIINIPKDRKKEFKEKIMRRKADE